jgi:hypothetical protein
MNRFKDTRGKEYIVYTLDTLEDYSGPEKGVSHVLLVSTEDALDKGFKKYLPDPSFLVAPNWGKFKGLLGNSHMGLYIIEGSDIYIVRNETTQSNIILLDSHDKFDSFMMVFRLKDLLS